jgi:hypothetical protein
VSSPAAWAPAGRANVRPASISAATTPRRANPARRLDPASSPNRLTNGLPLAQADLPRRRI